MDAARNFLLTFLGIGSREEGYEEALYLNEEDEILQRTRFPTLAVARQLGLTSRDLILLVCTKESASTLESLREALAPVMVREVILDQTLGWPSLIQVYEALESARGKSSVTLHLDITTGPRSAASVFLALLSFLGTGGRWTPGKLCYSQQLSPTSEGLRQFSLREETLLARMLELTTSARLLVDAGESQPLTEVLESTVSAFFQEKLGGTPPAEDLKRQRKIARALRNLGRALRFTALKEIQKNCACLQRLFSEVRELRLEFSFIFLPFEQDLALLWEGIEEIPDWKKGPCVDLHLRCIEWYLDHGRFDQASLAMAETMITLGVLARGPVEAWLDQSGRSQVRNVFNDLRQRIVTKSDISPAGLKPLVELWNEITLLRNRLAHCSMNPDPLRLGKDWEQKSREQLNRLQVLHRNAAIWGPLLPTAVPEVPAKRSQP